jgi:hypothetical protein
MPARASRARGSALNLDLATMAAYGELLVPTHIWHALQRFDAWIEPALIAEWIRLMHGYALSQGRVLDEGVCARAMIWSDPERTVSVARREAQRLLAKQTLHCVWTGRRLQAESLDIDHCFPWAAWPCDHLWNLMPSHRQVNQWQKRDRLPSHDALAAARERIEQWWSQGYLQSDPAVNELFRTEARVGLPAISVARPDTHDVYAGLLVQRLRLRQDQRVAEWGP